MTSYAYDALGALQGAGITHLDFCCVGTSCERRSRVSLAALIARHGPAISLVEIAREAKCASCLHHGAHIQPSEPRPPRSPGTGAALGESPWTKLVA